MYQHGIGRTERFYYRTLDGYSKLESDQGLFVSINDLQPDLYRRIYAFPATRCVALSTQFGRLWNTYVYLWSNISHFSSKGSRRIRVSDE